MRNRDVAFCKRQVGATGAGPDNQWDCSLAGLVTTSTPPGCFDRSADRGRYSRSQTPRLF
jgi:hypothetical protein